jgi:acetate kinase
VACFDTAFHARMPEAVRRYPVPAAWSEVDGIRRYGFHGLSVEWSVGRAATLLGRRPGALRLIVAHLGAGASVTAVDRGRSVHTSMGYTPLEGLMMASRSGSIDPGIVFERLRRSQDAAAVEDDLVHRSGLQGVGGSADMRVLLERSDAGDDAARLAIDMFVDRAAAAIAAGASRLSRLDAVVFTGGIGEHAGPVRAAIVRRLAVLGIEPIGARAFRHDRVLSRPDARPAVVRVQAREDLVIAAAVATAGRASLSGR